MNDYSIKYLKLICSSTISTILLDAKLVRCYPELYVAGETYQKTRD
jgi:hypothetical protein